MISPPQVLSVLLGLCLVGEAAAASVETKSTNSFITFTRPEVIAERGKVTGHVLVSDGRRFSFIPPSSWNLTVNAKERTLTFVSDDLGSSIQIKHVPNAKTTLDELKSGDARTNLQKRYPKALLTGQYECHTGGGSGVTFDIERHVEDLPSITCRVAMVPFGNDLIEFQLTTETRKLPRYRWVFGNLLTSFKPDSLEPIRQ